MLSEKLVGLRAQYVAAQLQGDRRRAIELIVEQGLGDGASVEMLQLHVIQEAQREIGQLWQQNAITVAQEHMATAISNAALAHLYDRADRGRPNGHKVVVACVDGELHDLPARLVADALDLAGFDVRYLGACVPTDSLLTIVKSERPQLVALSATMDFNLPTLETAIARLRRDGPSECSIIAGGSAGVRACADAAAGAHGSAADAAQTVTLAKRLLQLEGQAA